MTCPWSCIQNCIQKHRKKNNPHLNKHPKNMICVYCYDGFIVWYRFFWSQSSLKCVNFLGAIWGHLMGTPWKQIYSKNRTPPPFSFTKWVPRPWLDWKFQYCGNFFWQTSFCQKKCCEKLLSSSDPHPYTLFWHSFWHTTWTDLYIIAYLACFDILSDIPSGILCVWHIFMTFFLAFYLVYLRRFFVVEVRRGNTLIRSSRLRSGGEHSDMRLLLGSGGNTAI